MKRMEKIYWNSVLKTASAKERVKECLKRRVRGGPENYVAAGIMILIVVAIGIVFRDELSDFVTEIFNESTNEALTWF